MATHQITHIRKLHPHSSTEHITHVAYGGYVHTREEVIRLITARTDSFFVSVNGYTAFVEVVHPGYPRQPYIKTIPDGRGVDNLLSLPQC